VGKNSSNLDFFGAMLVEVVVQFLGGGFESSRNESDMGEG
jgi:hypothetical protein